MDDEQHCQLDEAALELFARKGFEGGPNIPQAGQSNGTKVRRIMQITHDLANIPFSQLRILDLGCGEGVYAIEAGLHGAEVLALDARTPRMEQGAAIAERHGLAKVRFIQEDVRNVKPSLFGDFDVVYLLGLLYHLDASDLFPVLENIYALCSRLLIIDTLISLQAETTVKWRGQTYSGKMVREHGDDDPPDLRCSRVLKSIDNTFSFRLTRSSLMQALQTVGFNSVFECAVPFEPDKAEDRITVAALKSKPVVLSTYPWVNGKTEDEIAALLLPGLRDRPVERR